jgi:hypothetical protein
MQPERNLKVERDEAGQVARIALAIVVHTDGFGPEASLTRGAGIGMQSLLDTAWRSRREGVWRAVAPLDVAAR